MLCCSFTLAEIVPRNIYCLENELREFSLAFPRSEDVLNSFSITASPPKSSFYKCRTLSEDTAILLNQNRCCLHNLKLLDPACTESPKESCCGSKCSVFRATRYLHAARIRGLRKRRQAKCPFLSSKMHPSAASPADQYSVHSDMTPEWRTGGHSLQR